MLYKNEIKIEILPKESGMFEIGVGSGLTSMVPTPNSKPKEDVKPTGFNTIEK